MAEENQPIGLMLDPPPTTPEEALAKNFYDWERRGRGWQLWVKAPELEPPFRPFFHYLPPRFYTARDDGRVLSFWDKVADWLTGRRQAPEEATEEEIAEPPPKPFDNNRDLVEIEIALPPTLRITKEVALQLLISLTYCSLPLSFEVIGVPEAIIIQLVCRDVDLYPLRQQFSAYFPEAVLTERDHLLSSLWLESGKARALVDFGLSREFFIPLKTFGGFETDPLTSFAGALVDLKAGEIGVLQILFEPARQAWAESIFRSITAPDGKPFFESAPELIGHARQKIAHPLYAAAIRIAAKSSTEDRAWKIAKALGGGLQHFGNPTVNELIPLENSHYPDHIHEEDLLGRQAHRCGMLLNSDELVSLVHPPSASVRVRKLRRLSQKTKAAPESAVGRELILGVNSHEGEDRVISLKAVERVRHMHVIGASGTGKSTFLLNMIVQDIKDGNGLAVLDPHGDLIDQIVEHIPEDRYGDVILFDPSDEEYPIGFNILSAHSEIEKHLLSSDLVSVFQRLSTSWGDQMTSVLGNAILAFLESERGGTLSDLRRFLVEKEFRTEFLKSVKDSEVVYYWQREFPMLTGKPQAPLLTRLDSFLRPKLIRAMVTQKENKLDFADIMDSRKIFLAKLSQGAIGEQNAYLLGSLLVSKFHQMVLARQDKKESERQPFFLYIDEFHHFLCASMTSILSGARKYRLGLILAHQELRQLGQSSSELLSAIMTNPYARICFRLGDDDARKMSEGFSFFEAKDLQNLGVGEAICRFERSEHDFNLQTFPLELPDRSAAEERVERITQLSRQRYGTFRLEAEEPQEAKSAKGAAQEEQQPSAPPKSAETSAAHPKDAPEPPAPAPPEEENASTPSAVSPKAPMPRAARKGNRSSRGRGGPQHKFIQSFIEQWTRGMGWEAKLEHSILNGAGKVDVALKRGKREIACEICITSSIEEELAHLEKCLKAGYAEIIAIGEDPNQGAALEVQAKKVFPAADFAKLRFCTSKELFRYIEEITAAELSTEKLVKGYKVKSTFQKKESQSDETRKKGIADAVNEAMRKRKEKGKEKRKDE